MVVAFADITDPELIAPAIGQTLGLTEQPGLTPAQRLERYLRGRELLLVLDNLEQLTPGVGVLGELLAGCPAVRMLVTSREALHLAGEQQYEVPVLEPEDAIELFVARAGAVAPNLVIERETAGAVCERLDRLPLAIELAAARTKVLTPREILDRLERRLPVTATGPRDAPRRQQTLQATIDWSYELLNEEEQRLLARLSVFAGGCTLQAAEAVCDGELDTLGVLVDRSLVRADAGRYWMLQTLREYALEKLARSGEEDHVRRAHAQWFIELHRRTSRGYADADMGDLNVVLGADPENFRAALEWAERAGEIETVARLVAPLTVLWCEEGRLSEADRWLGVVRERSAQYPPALQAWVLSAAVTIAWARGAYHEAADLCKQALALYRELGDVTGIVIETSRQAASEVHLGDLPGARAQGRGACARSRARTQPLAARHPHRSRRHRDRRGPARSSAGALRGSPDPGSRRVPIFGRSGTDQPRPHRQPRTPPHGRRRACPGSSQPGRCDQIPQWRSGRGTNAGLVARRAPTARTSRTPPRRRARVLPAHRHRHGMEQHGL